VFLKIFTPEILAIKGRSSSRQFYDIPLLPPHPFKGKKPCFGPFFTSERGVGYRKTP
jgi:hypothetical protein